MNNIIPFTSASSNKMNTGYLQLILGPMFSGKTSELVSLYKQYTLSKMNVCVINYAEDKRYDNEKMSTHDKVMIECLNTIRLGDIVNEELINKYDVYLINEGQFFSDIKEIVIKLVEKHNKRVHICGLDGDFKRNGFSGLLELIPYADDIKKKTSICMKCENGTRALFSYRLSKEQAVKVIGADNYMPVCRGCYIELSKDEE